MSHGVYPLVSCIVPCFNETHRILNESLTSLRDQSFVNFECIVVDESTDQNISNACKIFCESDERFIYIHPTKKIGLAASLNLGIKMAKGHFIARFDSDDICAPDRLALQVDFLNQNPEISVVGSALDIVDLSGNYIGRRSYPLTHDGIENKFIFSNSVAHPAVMFRSSILSKLEYAYDTKFRYAEDLDFWLRLLNCNVKFANLSKPLVKYRQQQLSRANKHWLYNLKARIKNLSSPRRFEKLIAIFGIFLWMLLPKIIQQSLFKLIQLRNH